MSLNCRACNADSLSEILDLGSMPSAGGFLRSLDEVENENLYPLPIFGCKNCGLIQITNPIDPTVLFRDYAFSSSTVSPLIKHFEAYASWLIENFHPKSVMEFGCNDGVLLKPLQEQGVLAVGVDISENITEIARSNGLNVETGFFDRNLAQRLKQNFGEFDLVTGSNAFAHNEHPEEILKAAQACLGSDGVLVLEVMYAGDLYEKLQWDTLYHEHLTFYSLGTLETLLTRFGFNVFDAVKLPMHGGSFRVSASLNKRPQTKSYDAVSEYERTLKLNDFSTWKMFGQSIAKKIDIVGSTLRSLSATKRIWAYGAAGKAAMWLNACDMDYLEAIVDESPLRAGRFMPGTHTPIVFPSALKENPPDYIFITAWNYADVIKSKEPWFEGIWITPLPDMKLF
jgi:novobiocin biosynthesis protein NovU/D-mycarose 3-C-methyltransferase